MIKIYHIFRGSRIYFVLFISISIAFFQAVFEPEIIGNFHKPAFEIGRFDILILQNIGLCLFFMVFLDKFEKVYYKIIDLVANSSFAVFFIHPIILAIGGPFVDFENFFLQPFDWLYLTGYTWSISFLIALLVRLTLPKISRRIIGW